MEKSVTIYDINVPEFIIKKLIENVPAENLIEAIKGNEYLEHEIFRGFKVSKENINLPMVINRIVDLTFREEPFLFIVVESWKAGNVPLLAFFESLNSDVIEEIYEALIHFVEPVDIFMTLICDERQEITDIANELLDKDNSFWNADNVDIDSKIKSIMPLVYYFSPLMQIFTKIEEMKEETPPSTDTTQKFAKEIKKKEKKLGKVQKEIENLSDRLESKEDLINSQKAEISRLNKELKTALSNYNKLLLESEESKKEIDKKIRESIENYKREILFPDLKMGVLNADDNKEKYSDDEDLLKTVNNAIEKQVEFNEEHKVSIEIIQKIKKIEHTLERIEIVAESSPHITEDLKIARDLLVERHDKHLNSLSKTEFFTLKDEYYKNCVNIINLQDNTTEAYDFLEKFRKKIEEDRKWGITTKFIAEKIFQTLKEKQHKILNFISESFKLKEIKDIPVNAIRDLEEIMRTEREYKYILFIDGYNVIKTVPFLKEIEEKEFVRAREMLKDLVVKKSYIFNSAYLVFDGVDYSVNQDFNIKIIFTNRKIGISADSFIVSEIERIKEKMNRIILITADREIVKNTYSQLYGVVNPYNFYNFLTS